MSQRKQSSQIGVHIRNPVRKFVVETIKATKVSELRPHVMEANYRQISSMLATVTLTQP